jgi:hypothetical protein
MDVRRRDVLKLLLSSAATGTLSSRQAAAAEGSSIRRDVCVIGGGSAGTYAALRLRDEGHSVVVLERSDRLGGHAETFHDTATGAHVDIGVIIFPDNTLVRNYFGRFGVALTNSRGGGGSSQHVDFRTGQPVDAFTPSPAELAAAFTGYLNLLTTQFGFLEQNGYRLPAPGPVLDELLLPFGQLAEKHGLTALLPTFFQFEQGFGSLLDVPSLYIFKNMSVSVVTSALRGTFLTTVDGVGALYEAATAELAGDVVFGAQVRHVDRRGDGVRVLVQTPEGLRVVHCEKLVVTAPPVIDSFRGFDLDLLELTTFARFDPNHYWTAVARISGYPAGVSLVNAAPETPQNIAPPPGIYSLSPTAAPGLVNVKYGSASFLPDFLVRGAIRADVERVRVPGVGPLGFQGYAIFKNHSPYSLMVRPDDVRAGFYDTLESLQGRNRTFYAGAAFQTHNSAAIWAYIEELLPRMFA